MVYLPLCKIWVSQLGLSFPIDGKIKNVPNHQSDNDPYMIHIWSIKLIKVTYPYVYSTYTYYTCKTFQNPQDVTMLRRRSESAEQKKWGLETTSAASCRSMASWGKALSERFPRRQGHFSWIFRSEKNIRNILQPIICHLSSSIIIYHHHLSSIIIYP